MFPSWRPTISGMERQYGERSRISHGLYDGPLSQCPGGGHLSGRMLLRKDSRSGPGSGAWSDTFALTENGAEEDYVIRVFDEQGNPSGIWSKREGKAGKNSRGSQTGSHARRRSILWKISVLMESIWNSTAMPPMNRRIIICGIEEGSHGHSPEQCLRQPAAAPWEICRERRVFPESGGEDHPFQPQSL